MYVHRSGVDYSLFIQNDRFANECLKDNSIFSYMAGENYVKETATSDLGSYLRKVVDSIPELKAAMETGEVGLAVFILPESTSSVVKDAVNQTTQKMLDEGTDENVLKGVLGIVKENYAFDIEYGPAVSHVKNDTSSYDMEALNTVLSKFKDIYSANKDLANGLDKFSRYVNEIYDLVQHEANPEPEMESTANNSTENDLVDTLIQEMEKSEDDEMLGSNPLNKKLYKNYIKSLKASLVGGLLQQSS